MTSAEQPTATVRIVRLEKRPEGEWLAVCDDGSDMYVRAADRKDILAVTGGLLPSAPVRVELDRLRNVTSWKVAADRGEDASGNASGPGPVPDAILSDSAPAKPRGLRNRVMAYLGLVAAGFVVGQIAAVLASRLLGRVAALEDAVTGGTFVFSNASAIGSAVYAFFVFVGVSGGLSALAGSRSIAEGITETESTVGLAAGVLAFLLVTVLVVPFYSTLATLFPMIGELILASEGLPRIALLLLVNAVVVAVCAAVVYLPLLAASRHLRRVRPDRA
jgi:hypothetical protein